MKKIKDYQLFLESQDSIESICRKYGIRNYTINEDYSIDVDGDVNLSDEELLKLPLKFRTVTGWFSCYKNQLTSLEGAPLSVGGDFYCDDNQLTSLKGCPLSVGGNFGCSFNKLTTLKGGPKEVGVHFDCQNNQLTSLESSPKSVGGNFFCSGNQLTNLVGGPEVVIGYYYASRNRINSFEGFPDDYEGRVYFTENPVQKVLNEFPDHLWTKAIHLIIDYDAIWNGEIVPERLEMVKDKLEI
jgi:hypothetical protein